jgi:hypothetical protein
LFSKRSSPKAVSSPKAASPKAQENAADLPSGLQYKLSNASLEAAEKFSAIEQEFKRILSDHAALKELWKQLDLNGNGKVSLAEVDKLIVEKFPILNHKAALMRAFHKTTLRDGDGTNILCTINLKAFFRRFLCRKTRIHFTLKKPFLLQQGFNLFLNSF